MLSFALGASLSCRPVCVIFVPADIAFQRNLIIALIFIWILFFLCFICTTASFRYPFCAGGSLFNKENNKIKMWTYIMYLRVYLSSNATQRNRYNFNMRVFYYSVFHHISRDSFSQMNLKERIIFMLKRLDFFSSMIKKYLATYWIFNIIQKSIWILILLYYLILKINICAKFYFYFTV